MDWEAIVVPSILSAAISYVVSIKSKQMDFSFDYKKYIVQRRKDAYEKTEAILSLLNIHTMIFRDGQPIGLCHKALLKSETEINGIAAFARKFAEAISEHVWYSTAFHSRSVEMSNYIADNIDGKTRNLDKVVIEDIAISMFQKLEEFRKQLNCQFFIDMQELNKLNKFKKRVIGLNMH